METLAAYSLLLTLAGLLMAVTATLYFDGKKSLIAFNIARAALIAGAIGTFLMAFSLVFGL